MSKTSLTCTRVTLRERLYEKTGRISLYLDFYPPIRDPKTMKQTRREYLGLYIYANPINDTLVAYNREIREKALAICCMRQTSLINEEFGFLDHNKKKMDFLPYFKTHSDEKGDKWLSVYDHFSNFCKGKCTFGDLTVEFCQKFQTYLLSAPQLGHSKHRMCKTLQLHIGVPSVLCLNRLTSINIYVRTSMIILTQLKLKMFKKSILPRKR